MLELSPDRWQRAKARVSRQEHYHKAGQSFIINQAMEKGLSFTCLQEQ